MSGPAPGGLLLIDKPSGPTSHDMVSRVRRAAGMRRVGHAGTLDPLATGLLPIVLGQATRLIRFLPASPKRYTGTLRLGATSDTDDAAGEISVVDAAPPAEEVVQAAFTLEGKSLQRPPAYSARHVEGRRLYEYARAGQAVEAPARPVEVFRFDLSPTNRADLFGFVAEVTGGTYIRALARDLGARLGCGGLLQSLRRTHIGGLDVAEAAPLPREADAEWVAERLVPPCRMPLEPPPARLDRAEDVAGFRQGRPCPWRESDPVAGWVRVLDGEGRLLGLATLLDGLLRPRVVLPP